MPTNAASRERPQYAALLDWLRSYVAGDGELGKVGDAFARMTITYQLAALARSCGAQHPELAAAERKSFVRAHQTIDTSARVVRLLERGGLAVVTLKGPALAGRFWGDVTFRPSGDVDVLVEPRDRSAAIAVLEAEGYETVKLYPDWYVDRWLCNIGMVAALGPKVEVHWSFVRPYLGRPCVETVLATREDIQCGSRLLPAPDPAWQLLTASVHTLFHDIALRTLLDVALIGRALTPPVWERTIAHARAAGLGPSLYNGVKASASLLDWTPPVRLDDLCPGPLGRRVADGYLGMLSPFSVPSPWARQVGKVATPLVSTAPKGLVRALPFSIVDRPRVLARMDAAVRRRVDRPPHR